MFTRAARPSRDCRCGEGLPGGRLRSAQKGPPGSSGTTTAMTLWEDGWHGVSAWQHIKGPGSAQHVTMHSERPQMSVTGTQPFGVDEQTEILAQRGWLTHHSLKARDVVLSVDPQTREISWEPVIRVHRFEYRGDLVRWRSRRMDA